MSSDSAGRNYSAIHNYPELDSDDRVDSTLINLMQIAEDMDGEFGIDVVLVLPGAVLSGRIVSRRNWYKVWLSSLGSSEAGRFAQFINILNESAGKLSDDGSLLDHDGIFLHILDGQLIGALNTNKIPWRVRAEQVSAWSLGTPTAE